MLYTTHLAGTGQYLVILSASDLIFHGGTKKMCILLGMETRVGIRD